MTMQSDNINASAAIAEILRNEPGLKLAILFGSAASGTLRDDSDIDIALLFDTPLDAERKLELVARLDLHLGRNIDLVDMAQLSGTILQQILCKGQMVIKNDAHALFMLLQRMIYNQADMMPYVTRTLMERQRRFVNG